MGDKSEAHERSLAKREDRSSRRRNKSGHCRTRNGPTGNWADRRRDEKNRAPAAARGPRRGRQSEAAFLSNYLLPFLGPEAPGSLTAMPAAPPWSCCFLLRMRSE